MKAATKKDLGFWRDKIDEVDRELVGLLVRRTEYAIEIGRLKLMEGLGVYDPEREEEVIRNTQNGAKGDLTREAIRRVFERIIDETRQAERKHRKLVEKETAAPEEGTA